MSNLFKSKKTETQKTEIDPAVYANVLSNIELANQLASVPFTPYQGLLTAPFTQDYMRGEQMTRAIARERGFVPELDLASRQVQADLGFQPERVFAPTTQQRFRAPTAQAATVTPGTTVDAVGAGQVATQFAPERVAAERIATQFGAPGVASQFAAPTVGVGVAGGPAPVREIGAGRVAAPTGPMMVGAERVATQFAAPTVGAGQVGTRFAARDVGGPGATPTVQGASVLGEDLARYQNPYQQAVIEAGLADISRAEEQARAGRSARATAARAFGGSRAAIEEGIAAGEAARERNRFVAEQRARGFQEAAAMRESDVGRQQQAALANQQAAQNVMQLAQAGQISNQERDIRLQQLGLTAEQANVDAQMRAELANQAAQQQAQQLGLTAGQFNVEQQVRTALANQQAQQEAARLGLTAEQANQQAQLEAERANLQARLQGQQLGTQTGQFNVEQQLRAELANQQARQEAQRLGLTAEQANQQAALEAQRLGLTAGQANQEAAMRAALANQQAAQTGQQLGLQAGQFNVQQAMEAARLNQAARLQAQQMTQGQQQFNAQQLQQIALANQQARQRAQEMGMTAEQFNAELAMRTGVYNQNAAQEAAQFRLGAAAQLGDFGRQALQNRYGAAAAMTGLGTAQQNLMQQYLDRQYQEFARQQNYPLQQLAIRQGAIAASPYNVTQTGTVTSRPSYWQMAGQIGSTIAGFSDETMKKNVSKIKNPLDKVNRLKGIEFEWEDEYKDDVEENGQKPEGKNMSVSAQDVEDEMPEAVEYADNGKMMVDFPRVVGLLTEAVKELDAKVEGKKRKGKK